MPSPPLQPARVALHAAFAVLPLTYWLAGIPRPPMLVLAAGAALAFVSLDAARLAIPRWNRWVLARLRAVLREREAARLTGASYTLVAFVLALWAFPPVVVAAAFLYHSVGDAAAGWAGRQFGRHRLGAKSLEGTVAFVLSAGLVAWPLLGGLPAWVGALVAGAAELLLPVDDNLSVPLAGGGSVVLLGRLTGSA